MYYIQTGRYNGTPEEERLCFNYPNFDEAEEHVLIKCDIYSNLWKMFC